MTKTTKVKSAIAKSATDSSAKTNSALRELPAVDEIVLELAADGICSDIPAPFVRDFARLAIEDARRYLRSLPGDTKSNPSALRNNIFRSIRKKALEFSRQGPTRVNNCTGVIAHTNLGRAPLSKKSLTVVAEKLSGYSNLELDLGTGKRGKRGEYVEELLIALTGAEAACVVNNCAAALVLILNTLANKKEVIVSRGELIQIGGGFRSPDILKASGAKLVEVGTTNITSEDDYRGAFSSKTALALKAHQSNFTQTGFAQSVDVKTLVAIGAEQSVPVVYDLGSGLAVDPQKVDLGNEASIVSSLRDGVDIVCFSGDKLLGGAQAGIIVGAKKLIAKMKKNPFYRALRPDKITLALAAQTIAEYLNGNWGENIPLWKMARRSESELYKFGTRIMKTLNCGDKVTLETTTSRYGGGSLPDVELPSYGLKFNSSLSANSQAKLFRDLSVPIIGRVEDGAFVLDLRAVLEEDESIFIDGLVAAKSSLFARSN
ncbi:MAG: L-seryl-tRNA(Sec) selenium transferase [candidate division Zixibacteria bacterium]|nr:L-seryl-tRNA(Sec) selenium transferase [candidate division Zixibacteria bacterium]